MDSSVQKSYQRKVRRALRVRKAVRGTADKPRMCVVKTNKHIMVQIINDETGAIVTSLSTNSKELRNTPFCKKNKASAKALGERVAERAKSLGVNQVVFDRGPFRFHGILAELAEGARATGLQF